MRGIPAGGVVALVVLVLPSAFAAADPETHVVVAEGRFWQQPGEDARGEALQLEGAFEADDAAALQGLGCGVLALDDGEPVNGLVLRAKLMVDGVPLVEQKMRTNRDGKAGLELEQRSVRANLGAGTHRLEFEGQVANRRDVSRLEAACVFSSQLVAEPGGPGNWVPFGPVEVKLPPGVTLRTITTSGDTREGRLEQTSGPGEWLLVIGDGGNGKRVLAIVAESGHALTLPIRSPGVGDIAELRPDPVFGFAVIRTELEGVR